ncbi:C-type lectin domain family 12 member B-like [Rana temporaria]|uniref:C-type lectin domain family 12 member B-like n=1 Tax=Rana temporaria TaxID=8407 RepID=UPI001AAE0359|nr:C-type lectin domain family 12 member B-like [Rana temporaria]
MTDAVTYADLRFGDFALKEAKHGGSTQEDPTEDVMYENFTGLRPPREKIPPPAPAIGRGHQLKAGLQKWSLHLSLVLLLLCLVSLAALIGLTVKYVQQSNDFQKSVTDHETMSGSMTRSLRSGEDLLESVKKKLVITESDLEKTRLELETAVQGIVDLNSSLLQCKWEEHNSTSERRATEEMLRDTRTKLDKYEKDFCPEGWIYFRMKCFWFSSEKKTWKNSENDCGSKNSKLIVVQQNDKELKNFLSRKGEFWVGKEIIWNYPRGWKWPTEYNSHLEDPCWKIDGGNLKGVACWDSNRWICERNLVLTALKTQYKNLEFILGNEEFFCYKKHNRDM